MPSVDTDTVIRVLDEEDDALITEAPPKDISSLHLKLDWAESHDASLTRIHEQHHDIELLDDNLGLRSGIESLHEAHSDHPHTPKIMSTRQGYEELMVQALQSGSIDDLPKQHISSETLQQAMPLQSSRSPNLPPVMMDIQGIRQALLNLIGNARQFTAPSGTVLVQAAQDPPCSDRVRVSIQDTGTGTPEAQLSGILEHLHHMEKVPTASSPGLGLGSFICRELIKPHKGTISVTSTVGQGSTFSFI